MQRRRAEKPDLLAAQLAIRQSHRNRRIGESEWVSTAAAVSVDSPISQGAGLFGGLCGDQSVCRCRHRHAIERASRRWRGRRRRTRRTILISTRWVAFASAAALASAARFCSRPSASAWILAFAAASLWAIASWRCSSFKPSTSFGSMGLDGSARRCFFAATSGSSAASRGRFSAGASSREGGGGGSMMRLFLGGTFLGLEMSGAARELRRRSTGRLRGTENDAQRLKRA